MEMMKWIHEAYVNGKVIYYAQKKSGINDGINFINGQQIKQINFIFKFSFVFQLFSLFFVIIARFNLIFGLLIFKWIFLMFLIMLNLIVSQWAHLKSCAFFNSNFNWCNFSLAVKGAKQKQTKDKTRQEIRNEQKFC